MYSKLIHAYAIADVNADTISPINAIFYQLITDKLLSACNYQIPIKGGGFLLDRLRQAKELDNFFAIADVNDQSKKLREDANWKCYVRKMDRCCHLLFVPSQFISLHRDESFVAKLLPIIVVECSSPLLMCPDPMQTTPPTLNPDIYKQVLYQPAQDLLSKTSLPTSPGILFGVSGHQLSETCSHIRSIHSQCFLDAMYSALKNRLDIVPGDFVTVTELCEKKSNTLDITPFIATLCIHCTVVNDGQQTPKDPEAVDTPSSVTSGLDYAHMIKLLRSQDDTSSITLSLSEGNSSLSPSHQPCVGWSTELQQQLQKMLSRAYYHTIPGTSGYYYFSVIPPVVSVLHACVCVYVFLCVCLCVCAIVLYKFTFYKVKKVFFTAKYQCNFFSDYYRLYNASIVISFLHRTLQSRPVAIITMMAMMLVTIVMTLCYQRVGLTRRELFQRPILLCFSVSVIMLPTLPLVKWLKM